MREFVYPISVAVIVGMLSSGVMMHANQKVFEEQSKYNEIRFVEFKTEVKDEFDNVNGNIKGLTQVLQDINSNSIKIENLEQSQKDLWRTINEMRD